MKIIPIQQEKNANLTKIKKELREKNLCYVLLTCSHPAEDGKMMIEVAYEGDDNIACYLIDSAQEVLSEKVNQSQNV